MKNRGFTLIELLVVVSIISLLSSITLSALNGARAKARYTQILGQMKQIEIAAHSYFTEYGNQAGDVGTGSAPAFVPTYLKSWPTPPCPGWNYDWENWSATTGFIGVNLRNGASTPVYTLCTDKSSVCVVNGNGPDIQTLTPKQIVCS